ncbi:MAG: hypothetical protein OEX14_11475, partial [Paracoccaceae bacterium]|nr:hypothetical protein [Paracoccaceae bacterium]
MYNTNQPGPDDLPSSAQLVKSTIVALGVAVVILFTAVLPAEYGIDPTGTGRMLGLTRMGEIKNQLAEEAAAEQKAPAPQSPEPQIAAGETAEPATAPAAEPQPAVAPTAEPQPATTPSAEPQPAAAPAVAAVKSDEMTIKLTPGQGAEIKLEMLKGATVSFHWTGNGGRVNYDTHGDPYGAPRSFYHGYGKGRFTPEVEGTLEAAFDGYHGWFWRNRTK